MRTKLSPLWGLLVIQGLRLRGTTLHYVAEGLIILFRFPRGSMKSTIGVMQSGMKMGGLYAGWTKTAILSLVKGSRTIIEL